MMMMMMTVTVTARGGEGCVGVYGVGYILPASDGTEGWSRMKLRSNQHRDRGPQKLKLSSMIM